jgi:hypothetical protein
MVALIFLVVGVAAAALYWVQRQATLKRQQRFRSVAAAHGWTYYTADPFATLGLDFETLRRGHDNKVTNMLVGADENGREVRVFDYQYKTGSGDDEELHRCTCVTLALGAPWPWLSISPNNVLNRMMNAVTHNDIEMESEEFNRSFSVHSNDRRFATAFVDPQMMTYLLSTEVVDPIEVGTGWLLRTFKAIDPEDADELIDVCEGIRAHIPSVVWELYPPRT